MKFIITGKTAGAVMLYDTVNKGSAVATYYTVNQLLDTGAEVLGVTCRKPFACNVLDTTGNPAAHGVKVEGVKRSAVTFLKGIKRSREELKTLRETAKKRSATAKAKKAEEKKLAAEQAKADKARITQEKKRTAIRKKMTVRFQKSKCLCMLSMVRDKSGEYHGKTTYYWRLYASTPAAMTNLVKILKEHCTLSYGSTSELIKRLRSQFNNRRYAMCRVPMDMDCADEKACQVTIANTVRLKAENDYEDQYLLVEFNRATDYRPSVIDCSGCDGSEYGPSACRESTKKFGNVLFTCYNRLATNPIGYAYDIEDYAQYC